MNNMSVSSRLGRIVLTLLVLALLVPATLLLFGCGSSGSTGSGMQVATYAYPDTPVTDWDPAVEFSNGIIGLQNIYESLLRYDPNGDKFTPVLATDYTKSADGKTWTFHIRQGVKFHDGTDLNAEAVKYSIERTIKIGKGAAFIWAPVKSIKVVDPYTVEFKLKYPAPIDLIAASAYGAYIVSPTAAKSHPADWFTQGHEAGTGPYMLESWKMGQEVVVTKFPEYWRGWEGEHFDKVVIQAVSEASTRRQMVTKGDADLTLDLPSEDVEALKTDSNVTVSIVPTFQNLWFFMNTKQKPLDNKLVRQAMSYAFPYSDVTKYAAGGLATQSYGAVPVGLWGYSDTLPQYTYDLAKAKQLLAQAGLPKGGFSVEMAYMSGDELERKSGELWKEALAKIGITLEIRGGPWQSIWNRAKSGDPAKRQGVFTCYWWPDVADSYSFLSSTFHSENTTVFNLAYYSNPAFDKLIDEGRELAGVDRDAAAKKYVEAQKILIDDAPAVFAFDRKTAFVLNKSFQGFASNPAYAQVVWFYDAHRE